MKSQTSSAQPLHNQEVEPPPSISVPKLESFVNDYLRNDLAKLEKELNLINADIMEYNQLKHTVRTILGDVLVDGRSNFKVQIEIGGNFFCKAKVEETEKILINVGLDHFVEFRMDEAEKFCDFKVRMLTKQSDLVREESLKIRARIKLALMCIGEQNKMISSN